MPAPQKGPLQGLKVLDLSHVMAGPTCARMLADMGADVIKVEKTEGGDDTRHFFPPDIAGHSAAFMMMNRNKRAIAIDLKKPEGREVLRRLAKGADILIENYRKQTMDKLGLGYEVLRKDNPGLIYCAISGFGRTGPYSERGGFDLIAQGMGGLMAITGEGPGRPPVKVGAPVSDITAGIIAAMGVLAAYVHRQKTGEGQFVDSSLFEAAISLTYWQSAICLASGISPGPMGSAHPLNAPYEAFEASDGWFTLGAANPANWNRLLDILDAHHLGQDPRFADGKGRITNRQVLAETLAPYFRKRTVAEWLGLFEEAGLPAGPVLSIAEMHADPQTLAREMVVEVEHAEAGPVKTIGHPVKFSETPGGPVTGAPLLGQHTREVLAEAGYGADEIEGLLTSGAVAVT